MTRVGAWPGTAGMEGFRPNRAIVYSIILALGMTMSSCAAADASSRAISRYARLLQSLPHTAEEVDAATTDSLIAHLLLPPDTTDFVIVEELEERRTDPEVLDKLRPFGDDQFLMTQMDLMYEARLIRNPRLRASESRRHTMDLTRHFAQRRLTFNGLLFLCGDCTDQRFKYLLDLAVNPNEEDWWSAIEFLQSMDSETASRHVEDLIEAKRKHPFRINAINDVLARFPEIDAARESVIADVTSDDPITRVNAIQLLGTMARSNPSYSCDDDLLSPLIKGLIDDDAGVRGASCWALKFHARCPGLEVPLWTVYYTDSDPTVKQAALMVLASVAPPSKTVCLLVDWLNGPHRDRDEEARIIRTLEEMGPQAIDAVPALEKYLYPPDLDRWSGDEWPGVWTCDAFRAITAILGHEPEVPEGWREQYGCP